MSEDWKKAVREAINKYQKTGKIDLKIQYVPGDSYITPKMWDDFSNEIKKLRIQNLPISNLSPDDLIGLPTLTSQCDCGSQHTSFKNHHYHWCSTRKWEKNNEK